MSHIKKGLKTLSFSQLYCRMDNYTIKEQKNVEELFSFCKCIEQKNKMQLFDA